MKSLYSIFKNPFCSSKSSEEDLNKNKYLENDMISQRTIMWVGIVIAILSNWTDISKTIESIFDGLSAFLKSLPPLILVGLLIAFIWWLGHKK